MKKLFVVILLCFSLPGLSQVPVGFPVIQRTELQGAKFLTERTFSGESLFGYMNGGAELYREYGIENAVITELEIDRSWFKIEIFRMTGPEEAFGIYSVSKFRCGEIISLPGYSCQTRYHLQICKGSWYVSIINRSGTPADSVTAVRIGNIIAGKIDDPPADISAFLPGADNIEIRRNSVLAKGKLGLANGAAEWEDYFLDIEGFCTVILPSENRTVISARFDSAENMKHFADLHGWSRTDIDTIDKTMPTGMAVRLLNENHLLISIPNP